MLDLVLCTLNRQEQLVRYISSLEHQRDQDWRLTVVDQNVDAGPVLRALGALVDDSRVTIVRLIPGLARARNVGLQRASAAGWVMFPDDDCYYPNDVALQGVCHCLLASSERVGVVVFPLATTGDDGRLTSELPSLRIHGNLIRTKGLAAPGLAFRVEALRSVAGFDERFGIGARYPADEDIDVIIRLLIGGWECVRVSYPTIIHPGNTDPDKLLRYAFARGALCHKHQGSPIVKGWLWRENVRHIREGWRRAELVTALRAMSRLISGYQAWTPELAPKRPFA